MTEKHNIKELIDALNSYYLDILGYFPKNTTLHQVPKNKWQEFSTQRGLNSYSSGVYLPRNQTAIMRGKNPLSLFHEYFGHGLYCEQSLSGKKLISLEKELLKKEKERFKNKQFSLQDLQEFRNQDETFRDLDNFRKSNLAQYELFAIWTEYLLSQRNQLKDRFKIKYDSMKRENREVFDPIIDFSKQYGNLATFYAQGMARKTTTKRVNRLLREVCKNKLDSIKLGVLYGSKKPFSDIDIYLVSDEIKPFHSDWIDVRIHSFQRFKEGFDSFDLRVTDPIMSGEFVFGDKNYFDGLVEKLKNKPINQESIAYNLQKAKDYSSLPQEELNLSDRVKDPKSYALTYRLNALALKEGLKLLTKDSILSQSDKFGGK
ncbi:MAG: hypothetical protein U9Q69_06305 [Nanoarchaeota archaeon]|nr:hypothetical protein [Nanoarchaeota archaeon]